jgi:predicted O-linked N-acetylglucosamine transferase (SPINDLY family)
MDSSALAEKANRQGVSHCLAGRFHEGVAAFREAVRLSPDSFQYHLNLGNALNEAGLWKEAEAALLKARALAPDEADIHRALVKAAIGLGQADALARHYKRAAEVKPGDAMAQRNAGIVLLQLGLVADAVAVAQGAADAAPADVESKLLLAECFSAAGRPAEAERVLMELLKLQPRHIQAGLKLGVIRSALGHYEAAAGTLESVLRLSPDNAEAMQGLAFARLTMGQVTDAILLLRRLIRLQPRRAAAHQALGWALTARGSLEDAADSYRAAMALAPDDRQLSSNLAYTLSLIPSSTRSQIWDAHRQWGRRFGGAAAARHRNGKEPERRLKIGYVSPDFREHSIAYFLEPLLKAHDRSAFEIFCYADGVQFDATTERLKSLAGHWRFIGNHGDDAVMAGIASDGIDILVDLAGHTANNRLGLFAKKPAPVQFTWLGYPETTGLSAIDGKITDDFVSPPGEAEGYASEALVRLAQGFHCYQPPPACPEVAPAPCLEAGHVTFGSFADLPKVNPETVHAWAAAMRAVSGSRMLVKCRQFADESVRDKYLAMFRAAGIAPERLTFMGRSATTAEHLGLYRLMDICLDTFPYSGTTTICEALWMGVPVVTMIGDRPASRVGGSVLRQAGLGAFVADSADSFAAIASSLAGDKGKLAELRAGMRRRLDHSSLRDAEGFARAMEAAYRAGWRTWCLKAKA